MKIAILSRNSKLYSTRRLVEAGEARGHHTRVIDTLRCYMNIAASRPEVRYKDEILDDIDAIIPRIGASITFYGTAVVRQFEMAGTYSVNESVAISRSRDKLRSLQLLAKKGIGLPVTGFANSTRMTHDLIKMVGGAPLIVKLLEGTQGVGVVLCETNKAAESVIEAFRGLHANFIVQEFIKEARGADFRCFVIGDRVVDDETPGQRRRVPFELTSRRQRVAGKNHAAGAHHRRAGRAGDGLKRGRRRFAPVESRSGRDGSQFVAGSRRHRNRDGHGHRRADHRVHRKKRATRKNAHARQRLIPFGRIRRTSRP